MSIKNAYIDCTNQKFSTAIFNEPYAFLKFEIFVTGHAKEGYWLETFPISFYVPFALVNPIYLNRLDASGSVTNHAQKVVVSFDVVPAHWALCAATIHIIR